MAELVRDFGGDDDGDLEVVANDFTVVSGRRATSQGAQVRAAMWQGDCFIDTTVGVPYTALLSEKGIDPLVLREAIRERIASVPDILQVNGSQIVVDAERVGRVSYRFRDRFSQSTVLDQVEA